MQATCSLAQKQEEEEEKEKQQQEEKQQKKILGVESLVEVAAVACWPVEAAAQILPWPSCFFLRLSICFHIQRFTF